MEVKQTTMRTLQPNPILTVDSKASTSSDQTAEQVTQRKSRLSTRAQADLDLVEAAIGGNQMAYGKLMDRHNNTIYHMMYKMVKNRDDAEDLAMEAFGKAFHKLKSYTPTYAFSTWLFRIAINNCIDHMRKKRLKIYSIDDTIEPDGDQDYSSNIRSEQLNPEEQAIRKEKLGYVREVIKELSDKYRLMIELRFFMEYSYDEIATELDIPLGTVKAQLFRAKQLLLEKLKEKRAAAYLNQNRIKDKKGKGAVKAA